MRLADINPSTGRAWKKHSARQVGAWRFADSSNNMAVSWEKVRMIWHYGTYMGCFVGTATDGVWSWEFHHDDCLGWASVSDQHGMNKIVQGMGGWYYSRKGGAQWVQR